LRERLALRERELSFEFLTLRSAIGNCIPHVIFLL
jgi:hypothetical protein